MTHEMKLYEKSANHYLKMCLKDCYLIVARTDGIVTLCVAKYIKKININDERHLYKIMVLYHSRYIRDVKSPLYIHHKISKEMAEVLTFPSTKKSASYDITHNVIYPLITKKLMENGIFITQEGGIVNDPPLVIKNPSRAHNIRDEQYLILNETDPKITLF